LRDLDFRKHLRQSRGDRFAVIECPAGNDAGMSIRPQRLWIDGSMMLFSPTCVCNKRSSFTPVNRCTTVTTCGATGV